MTLLRAAGLVAATGITWFVDGGFLALLDAVAARTRRERRKSVAWSLLFLLLAVGVVWVLTLAAAAARSGT